MTALQRLLEDTPGLYAITQLSTGTKRFQRQ